MKSSHKVKIFTVVGARPHFMKVDANLPNQYIIHTGQHYDYEMSQVFFKQLKLPKPYVNLNCKNDVGKMITKLKELFTKERPQLVIVYGDTYSTLAGALAAAYCKIPLVHIEAGCRSYTNMPEEVNRVLVDKLAQVKVATSITALRNLDKERLMDSNTYYFHGDPMFDALQDFLPLKKTKAYGTYYLLTIHREENNEEKRLRNIITALGTTHQRFIWVIHPRTAASIKRYKIKIPRNIEVRKPVGYKEILLLESNARKIVTDSGGMQREAYWFRIPCITLRKETEWEETVADGWATLVDADQEKIIEAVHNFSPNPANHQSELPVFGVQKQIRDMLGRYL